MGAPTHARWRPMMPHRPHSHDEGGLWDIFALVQPSKSELPPLLQSRSHHPPIVITLHHLLPPQSSSSAGQGFQDILSRGRRSPGRLFHVMKAAFGTVGASDSPTLFDRAATMETRTANPQRGWMVGHEAVRGMNARYLDGRAEIVECTTPLTPLRMHRTPDRTARPDTAHASH